MSTTHAPTVYQRLEEGAPLRVLTDLAASTTLTNAHIYHARFVVPPFVNKMTAVVKCAVSGGTPTAQLIPQTADINPPDLTVSNRTTGLTTATNLSDGTAAAHSLTLLGEKVVDLVIDSTGASAAGSVTYIDVEVVRA